eukprot:6195336-Pleurochrysis_carterae.AAC.1
MKQAKGRRERARMRPRSYKVESAPARPCWPRGNAHAGDAPLGKAGERLLPERGHRIGGTPQKGALDGAGEADARGAEAAQSAGGKALRRRARGARAHGRRSARGAAL